MTDPDNVNPDKPDPEPNGENLERPFSRTFGVDPPEGIHIDFGEPTSPNNVKIEKQPKDSAAPPPGTHPADRPLRIVLTLMLAAVALACFGLARLGSSRPDLIEYWFTERFGFYIALFLTRLTAPIPTSLAEWVILAVAITPLWWTFRGILQVLRRRRGLLNALGCFVTRLVMLVAVIVSVFYITWGFNYSRAGFIARQGWEDFDRTPDSDEAAAKELKEFAERLVEETNRAFMEAFETNDPGVPSTPPEGWRELDKRLESAYQQVGRLMDLHASFSAPRAPAKPVLFAKAMSYTLISGVYSPYTGEANYNPLVPPCHLAHTIAHEKAHQRGITSEDEANFFGFLACIHAASTYARYSGWLMAQRQILGLLNRVDPEAARALADKRLPGIRRDLEAAAAFYQRYAGRVSQAQHRINDAYLKVNRVKGGAASYGMSARLILAYCRWEEKHQESQNTQGNSLP